MHARTEHIAREDTSSLLDAVLLLSSDLDLRGALERLVRAACALSEARYGFLALIDDNGAIADFVTHGLDDEARALIQGVPEGHGLLALLLADDAKPLRVDDIAAHPKVHGFPKGHPSMVSFLGVPVRVHGQIYGNLYLTEKRGGQPFTGQDEQLLDEFAQIAGAVIANARTHATTTTRHRWLEASLSMSHALQASANPELALADVVMHLCAVADAVAVAAVHEDDDGLEMVAAIRGDAGPVDDVSLVERWGKTIAIAGAEERAVLADRTPDAIIRVVVPMSARLLRGHYLLVALDEATVGVDGPDLDLYSAFADQASLVLDRSQALAERQDHMLLADRNRIAQDLHDTVIQRIFATALQLQSLQRTVDREDVNQRLDEYVGELNTTIRDIRSTIFELRQDLGTSLQTEIRGLAQEYVPVLGFTPFVRMRGPIDAAVPPATAENLIATLRETLSNVARHAEADACLVEVEARQDRLVLRVSDNGRGVAGEVAESGLRNVRRRAFDHGGTFRIGPEVPHGTLIEWEVPLG
jgi:signal transduction histidine kinase